jgi:hypothetical protein
MYPAMYKVVAKITGVLYRATGASVDLRLKQDDRALARLCHDQGSADRRL